MSQKSKYIPWYSIIVREFGDLVPDLSDDEIQRQVSSNDWLMVPTPGEKGITEGKNRDVPNLYIVLDDGKIRVGLSYQNILSLEHFKNIDHEFHAPEKSLLVKYLLNLDDIFETRISRKIKEHFFRETPKYDVVDSFRTNTLNNEQLEKLIEHSDKIREEGRHLKKMRHINFPPITPDIDLFTVEVNADEKSFIEILSKIKPIYEIVVSLKTSNQIKDILDEDIKKEEKNKLNDYHSFTQILNKLRSNNRIDPKERRNIDEKWRNSDELTRKSIMEDLNRRLSN
jgi:hypothetical protein